MSKASPRLTKEPLPEGVTGFYLTLVATPCIARAKKPTPALNGTVETTMFISLDSIKTMDDPAIKMYGSKLSMASVEGIRKKYSI